MSIIDNRASRLVSLITTALILATILFSWFSQLPAANEQFSIGNQPFSMENTKAHISVIAQRPHYLGTEDNTRVRNYIVDQLQGLGLEVNVQSQFATSNSRFAAAYVNNIVARLPSNVANNAPQASRKALALMTHYDSANTSSIGASDAGHGVAIILEGLRTLIKSGASFKNDVLVIITDGEEQGLLGAEAFIAHHPWAKDVGLTLNFEARGSGGVSYTLMETNAGNKKLIAAYANAGIRYPAANSLMYSIYKMLPNDTDLTVFRQKADINGFNFAFIDDHFDYHTQQDTPQRLDDNTLNHQINYITTLLPFFADQELNQLDSDIDHVYFNFANLGIVDYPFDWVLPMVCMAILIFLALCVIGKIRKRITLVHALISIVPVLLIIAIGVFVGMGGWAFLVWLFPQFTDIPQGFTYNGHYIIACFVLLAMSVGSWFYSWLIERVTAISRANWYAGITFIWLLINLGIALFLTGAGFFIVVSLVTLLIFSLLISTSISANKLAMIVALSSVPVLVIITPQIPVFVIGLGLSNLAISTTLSLLILSILLPLLFVLKGIRSIQLFMFAGAIISFIGIVLYADYSADQKKPSSVNYVYDTQSKQGYLFSYNQHLDQFTQQFFTADDWGNDPLHGIYPITPRRYPTMTKAVPTIDLVAVSYLAKRETLASGSHSLSLSITPNRQLFSLMLSTDEPVLIESLSVNDYQLAASLSKAKTGFLMRYMVQDKRPVTLNMLYKSESPAQLRLIEFATDLPQQWPDFKPRPNYIMPTPFRPSDMTIISQPIVFE